MCIIYFNIYHRFLINLSILYITNFYKLVIKKFKSSEERNFFYCRMLELLYVINV